MQGLKELGGSCMASSRLSYLFLDLAALRTLSFCLDGASSYLASESSVTLFCAASKDLVDLPSIDCTQGRDNSIGVQNHKLLESALFWRGKGHSAGFCREERTELLFVWESAR